MIKVYNRYNGRVLCHVADTHDPIKAAEAVAWRFNEIERLHSGCSASMNMRLSATRWSLGPFLAVVAK
ncbi:hypothetical protein [Paraburkholderia sp. BR14320]|uniref:hypothetical protein n=1 Tax=unclassified Paraburkholderia TaxID=2615204 RepID=UPI0034CD3D0E